MDIFHELCRLVSDLEDRDKESSDIKEERVINTA